jgi:hypothetical protein
MIHINTTNKSFLKVYHLLKEKGVKDCTFFLELHDESLEFVDPFDVDNLSEEEIQRIIIECTTNPWYFIRECILIPASGIVRYELNLGNLAFTWAVFNNLSVFLTLPRQCGKTFAAAVVIVWVTYFGGLNTESMLYAQTDRNLDNNSGRIRSLRQSLPEYLNLHNARKDRDGIKLVQFTALGNKILRQAPKKSELAADSVGRGFSTPVAWYDEFAFIPHIKTQYQASVLAQSTVAKLAQKNGLPNSVIITTTAAFLNNNEGRFAYNFLNDCLEFDESMYSLSREEVLKLMDDHAKRKFLRIFYPYWELGKDDAYFQEQATLLGWDKDDIDREILCKWKEVDTDHPLGQDAVTLLENNIHKPVKIVVVNDIYRVKFYKDPSEIDWAIPYIIGGDCANNIGKDYSALVVIDPRNYEVIATVRTNMYSTMFFAHLIISLMRNYFFKSTLVLERNLNGATILDRVLEEDISLRDRIYAPVKKPDVIGISTVSKSRTLLYKQVLKTAVDDSFNLIHDRTIIDEIKGLIKTRTGRIDHAPGGHDDLLISYLFARWFLVFGERIERYINPLIVGIFSDIKGENETMNEKTRVERQEQFMEKEREEYNSIHNMFKKQDPYAYLGNELPSLKEQHDSILDDSPIGFSRRGQTADSIFNMASRYDRFNPGNTEPGYKDKTLYELEKEDNGEENDTEETDDSDDLYFKNPRDIGFKKKAVRNTNQLEREVILSNDISDLSSFMNQFKRR